MFENGWSLGLSDSGGKFNIEGSSDIVDTSLDIEGPLGTTNSLEFKGSLAMVSGGVGVLSMFR